MCQPTARCFQFRDKSNGEQFPLGGHVRIDVMQLAFSRDGDPRTTSRRREPPPHVLIRASRPSEPPTCRQLEPADNVNATGLIDLSAAVSSYAI
jgi:hypothetical protein